MTDRNPGGGTFAVLPAIDLRDGRVVRLVRGDFALETVYGDDPIAMAEWLVREGAGWLHVVDLDGALDPGARQTGVVAGIVAGVGERTRVEVAGGLRDEAAVAEALAAGAARAVVGTAVLRDPGLAGRLVAAHGADRIAAALDVREGLAVGHGWKPGAPGVRVAEAVEGLADAGVATFEVTAIDRDGTLEGPDLDLLARVVGMGRGAVIASAGIASIADLQAVRALGCAGAIVGRALYDGRLTVAAAVELELG